MTPTQLLDIKKEFDYKFMPLFVTSLDGKDRTYRLIGDDVWQFIESKLKAVEEEYARQIKALMFMHEHYWVEDDKERVCEICGEVVTKYSPCTRSVNYRAWEDLNILLEIVQSNKLGGKDGNTL